MDITKGGVTFVSVFLLSITFVSALHSDISSFEANILGEPEPVVSISVPDSVFFGDLEKGKRSDEIRINITNTGTVGVFITPQLVDTSEKIFNYTYFARRTTNPFERIGNFTFNITAPARGEVEKEFIYARLDLISFTGNINNDIPGHKADVRFFAVAM
ncbi:MAG: hypothetical protein Q7S27_04890 [Nanoarchaeota archaeon]|nr:hypothetical protein [Nanoarchaeota archaeon]